MAAGGEAEDIASRFRIFQTAPSANMSSIARISIAVNNGFLLLKHRAARHRACVRLRGFLRIKRADIITSSACALLRAQTRRAFRFPQATPYLKHKLLG